MVKGTKLTLRLSSYSSEQPPSSPRTASGIEPSATTPSAPTTLSTSSVPGAGGNVTPDCPSLNGTNITSTSTSKQTSVFKLFCDYDINGPNPDLNNGLRSPSLNDCLQHCVDYGPKASACLGVTYNAIPGVLWTHLGNCFLKPNVSVENLNPMETKTGTIASAVLIG